MSEAPKDDDLLMAVARQARLDELELARADIGAEAFAALSDEELEALAERISSRLSHEPREAVRGPARATGAGRRRWAWVALAAAVLGASLGPLWDRWSAHRGASAGDSHASSDAKQLSLPDGSTLVLLGDARANVLSVSRSEVRVQLERGRITCEVAPDPARRFVVAAGGLEVVVKGTRFTVSMGGASAAGRGGVDVKNDPDSKSGPATTGGLMVSVESGLVEVREPPARVLALLTAGQSWASDGEAAPARVPAVPPAAEPLSPCSTCEGTPEAADASGAVKPEAPAAPTATRGDAVAPPEPGPRQLFERANAAHLAGHASEAATAFDELRRRYPSDARAGYAAFMLGRIRLSSLDDANGAVEAFTFALAHPGSGFFLEDAEARRIEALARAGRNDECRVARDRFLASYPRAVRAPLVARQCDPR